MLVVAGCGTTSEASSNPATSGNGIVIALNLTTLANPYFVQLRQGAEAEARALGATLVVQDAQNEVTTQINQVRTVVAQGVQAVIINPVDSDLSVPAANAAANASIPVIAVDRSLNSPKVTTEVSSDNVQGGQMAAEALAKVVGPGDVVLIRTQEGASTTRDRDRGFNEGVALRSATHLVGSGVADSSRTKAVGVMANLLQQHPEIRGVFAENDEMALGAISALGGRAGRDIAVVGFDGTGDGLTAVAAGKMAATIAQQPREIGSQAVETAVRAARREHVRELIEVPVKEVTRENVGDFRKN
jgi:ABC-type sugar transport system substrate-binding protein